MISISRIVRWLDGTGTEEKAPPPRPSRYQQWQQTHYPVPTSSVDAPSLIPREEYHRFVANPTASDLARYKQAYAAYWGSTFESDCQKRHAPVPDAMVPRDFDPVHGWVPMR